MHIADRALRIHKLKTWPDVFQEIEDGNKLHEFRKNDRDFKAGDLIELQEYQPDSDSYTGREILAKIRSISYGPEWGIPEGFAVFTIQPFFPRGDR